MPNIDAAEYITGTIRLVDGSESAFSIASDGVWQQWGATQERLGRSVDILDAMVRGLVEDSSLASSADNDDESEAEYDLSPDVTLDRRPLPQAIPEGHIGLALKIENTYELYDDVTTYASVSVPLPPSSEGEDDASVQARTDWSWNNINPLTGVGRTDGDSWYDVMVLESSDPAVIPVGTTWEFGY